MSRIFILGFMGTGKTHWSQQWADVHDAVCIDLDQQIEQEVGRPVLDIFEEEGEDFFRDTEAKMLREVSAQENIIVATGGGTPCFHENMQWMNDHGITVLLEANAQYILERVLHEKNKRPLIKNLNEAEILFFIQQKLQEREPFYAQARYKLDAEKLTYDSLYQIIPTLNKSSGNA